MRTAPLPKTTDEYGEIASADWQALRDDLVALLEQVDGKKRSPAEPDAPSSQDAAPRAFKAETAAAQTSPHPEHNRRTEALKSVRQAVERFSAPEAVVDMADHSPAPRRNPQNDLQAAIQQIRERTEAPAKPFTPPAAANTPSAPHSAAIGRAYEAPSENGQIIKLTQAIGTIMTRLERFEVDLHNTRESSGEVAEIASQVSQLTNVVEMLANAVGETGQVKRLEGQIGQLAKLVTEGAHPEISALTQRIEDVAATVERLADMQVQQMGRDSRGENSAQDSGASSMQAIEAGVRNIYDRIDAIETNFALNPDDIARLTQELSAVTHAMQTGTGEAISTKLLAHVDALNARVSHIESHNAPNAIGDLKADVSALRAIVAEAVEPRFAALETQIEALSGRVGSDDNSASFSQLEAQIRHLISQMDHAGQQLSGLSEQYADETDRGVTPDPEELAALVARRTSEEISRLKGPDNGLNEASLQEMEKRLSRLFANTTTSQAPEALTEVNLNITRVDDRLSRLEKMLSDGMLQTDKLAPAQTQKPASAFVAPAQQEVVRSTFDTEPQPSHKHAATRVNDAMPSAPLDDMPLRDPGFPSPHLDDLAEDWSDLSGASPVQKKTPASAPVERLAELAAQLGQSGKAAFNPDEIERPAKPLSSFDQPVKDAFAAPQKPIASASSSVAAKQAAPVKTEAVPPVTRPMPANATSSTDRNTFIAAARRAAQQQHGDEVQDASTSLIGRAFARFQNKSNKVTGDVEPEVHADVRTVSSAAHVNHFDEEDAFGLDQQQDEETSHKTSLLGIIAKNKRALLLGACVVVALALTANLVIRRSAPTPEVASSNVEQVAPTTDERAPGAEAEGLAPQSMLDPQPTGSIDPFIQMDLTRPSPSHQTIPGLLSYKATGSDAAQMASQPVRKIEQTSTSVGSTGSINSTDSVDAGMKLALPPEALGHLGLREAAANGNPQAQFEVAAIYTEGQAVPQDYAAAAVWYERSAAQGFAPAQYRLGNLFEHGQGVTKDLEQARLWYQRSAEAGNRMSMHNLAALYAGGALGEQKFPAAAEWFERAANQGMTDSQFNLGMLYARGLGVKQDMAESYKWFSLAANSGDKDAAKARDDVARSLDAQTVMSLQEDVAKWQIAPIALGANFAPIGTWTNSFDPGATIAERAVIERVQFILNRLGFNVGTPDGVTGPKTTLAIKEFERALGMNEIGMINPRLLAVLGSQPV